MICSRCREDKPSKEFYYRKTEKRHHYYCKPCLYEVQTIRWKKRKIMIVEVLGGRCQHCGYKKNYCALELHHLDKATKKYDWNKLRLYSWNKILEEIKKCILLCANCHRELEYPNPNDKMVDSEGNAPSPAL